MPLDAQAEDFLRRLAAANLPPFHEQTVEQLRAQMDMSTHFLGELPKVARVEDCGIPGPGGALRVRSSRRWQPATIRSRFWFIFMAAAGSWGISNRTRGFAGRWPTQAE